MLIIYFQPLSLESGPRVLITLNFGMDSPCKILQNPQKIALRAQLGWQGLNISHLKTKVFAGVLARRGFYY